MTLDLENPMTRILLTPLTTSQLPALLVGPTPLSDAARIFATASLSAATRLAYSRAFGRFGTWCAERGTSPLAGDAAAVANYLADLAGAGKATPTIRQAYAAIRAAHDWAGAALTETAELRRVRAGIRRTAADNGVAPAQAIAICTADVQTIADLARSTLDRAMVLVGFAGALRRSELTGFRWRDLELGEKVAVVTLRRSKGDQDGAGQLVVLDATGSAYCPVQALRQLAATFAGEPPPDARVFPRAGRTVSRILKRLVARTGASTDRVSGHSLRAGMITELEGRGVPIQQIQAHARHKDINTTVGYVRPLAARRSTLVQQAGL